MKTESKFLVLIIPPNKPCRLAYIGHAIEKMEEALESKKASFDYFDDVIIATNKDKSGLKKNPHIEGMDVCGTCYLIGNQKDDDFRSLTLKEINHLFPKYSKCSMKMVNVA
jgi:cytochrome c peroxidase